MLAIFILLYLIGEIDEKNVQQVGEDGILYVYR